MDAEPSNFGLLRHLRESGPSVQIRGSTTNRALLMGPLRRGTLRDFRRNLSGGVLGMLGQREAGEVHMRPFHVWQVLPANIRHSLLRTHTSKVYQIKMALNKGAISSAVAIPKGCKSCPCLSILTQLLKEARLGDRRRIKRVGLCGTDLSATRCFLPENLPSSGPTADASSASSTSPISCVFSMCSRMARQVHRFPQNLIVASWARCEPCVAGVELEGPGPVRVAGPEQS